jgi:hypothetical protein
MAPGRELFSTRTRHGVLVAPKLSRMTCSCSSRSVIDRDTQTGSAHEGVCQIVGDLACEEKADPRADLSESSIDNALWRISVRTS